MRCKDTVVTREVDSRCRYQRWLGYDLAAEVAKEAQAHGLSLAQVLLRRGLMTAADVERLLDPLRMTRAPSTPADG